MDPALYKAAKEGNTGDGNFILADHLQRDEENGYQVSTSKGNTVLHVAALYDHSHFVEEVLKISMGSLCYQNKIKKETALHIAANEGHTAVVRVLLSKGGDDKETLMRMTDVNGDTALHKAVRSQHLDIVRLLVKEDPEFELPANNAGETPLYLAAESGFCDILDEILESCKKLSNYAAGPYNRTPLHAAVIQGNTDCARSLWQWNKSLCEEADKWGWNSLHYAVKIGLKEVVSDMLGWKKSLAHIPADNDGNTPVHLVAASWNHVPEELMSHPRAKKMSFNKENQTPLDIALTSACTSKKEILIDKLRIISRSGKRFKEEWKAMYTPKPKDETETSGETQQRVDDQNIAEGNQTTVQQYMSAAQIHVIVATLLMTVTFAAGFTLPGGFESDPGSPTKGMAILIRNTAFRAFVVTDAIAFTCSAAAIFIYFIMADSADEKNTNKFYCAAINLQLVAMTAVVTAFVTGMYATLAHSLGLGVTVCIIGCITFLMYFWVLYVV